MTTAYDEPIAAANKGIFAKLHGSASLLALAPTIANAAAPFKAGYPLCTFRYYAGLPDDWSFSQRVRTQLIYTIKGVSYDDGGQAAAAIAAKLDVLLNDAALSVGTGWRLMKCRGNDSPISYEVPAGGSHQYYHRGRRYSIDLEATYY